MDSKIPNIRFKGFTDAWEQRRFGDTVTIERGGSPRPISKYITNSEDGLNWIKIGDAPEEGNYITHTAEKILPEGLSKTREVHPGDLILSNSMSFGKPYIMEIDGCIHDGWLLIRNDKNKFELKFLCVLLGTDNMINQYKAMAAGSTVNNLNKQLVGGTTVSFPSSPEQQQIGAFFAHLDTLISLHQRKCDQTKELKKTMLQKMFPKKGETVPEIRFPEFTDAWEQRKLNEVSDIYDGTHQTPKYQDNGVMFLSVENIKTLTSNKFISREAFEDEFKIRPQRGDVLMTRIGDIGTANVVETDEDLAYYVSLALFKSEELNPYFLQASIYSPFVQDQIWKRTLHIAFPKKINKNEIGQVPINVPTLAEQTKIGSFFKQLDNTITLHQRKCDELKEIKKTLLKNLFI